MTLAANLMVSMASKFESKPLLPTLMETMAGMDMPNYVLKVWAMANHRLSKLWANLGP